MGWPLPLTLGLAFSMPHGQELLPYQNKVSSKVEFDRLARITTVPYELPHVLVLIDRQDGDKVYFADSKRPWGHREFANAMYLSLDDGPQFVANNYYSPQRRFILGWVSYYTPVKTWTYEFWEGDQMSRELIAEADRALNASFFTPLSFKPNSLALEAWSVGLKNRLLPNELAGIMSYQPMNTGRTVGRLQLLPHWDDSTSLQSTDIPVLDEFPISITPVAGMICAQPTTPLSHLNILARTWGVPSIWIKDAWRVLEAYDGKWICLNAKTERYWLRLATDDEIAAAQAQQLKTRATATPRHSLRIQELTALSQQRAEQVTSFGAKSANLGEVCAAGINGVVVPEGFTIPFYWHDRFLEENKLKPLIADLCSDPRMRADRTFARRALSVLRHRIETGDLDPHFKQVLLDRVNGPLKGRGVFVRSSTNAEDLPNFSGAGLYTTVPNVVGDQQIVDAVRKVWASIWNDEAYFAREQAGIDHQSVFMAVLLQVGIESDSAGVMITTDPFNPGDTGSVFISAKRGLGIKVVEGKKVPEQLVYHRRTNAIQVLTRSAEDSLLQFDEQGGIKELPIAGDRVVLTDAMVRRLVAVAEALKLAFHGVEQDIEWAFKDGQVYILQSRPYKT